MCTAESIRRGARHIRGQRAEAVAHRLSCVPLRLCANAVELLSQPMPKKKFPKPGDVLSGIPPGPGEGPSIDMAINMQEGRAVISIEILT